MDILEAISLISEVISQDTQLPVVRTRNRDAANTLSAYFNMEGGYGFLYGTFRDEQGEYWEVDLRKLPE